MNARKIFWIPVTLCLALYGSSESNVLLFSEPIDAISFTLRDTSKEITVQYKGALTWSDPQAIGVHFDSKPSETESDLMIFPESVQKIRVNTPKNITQWSTIKSDNSATSYEVAALTPVGTPRILSRRQWGADESFTIRTSQASQDDTSKGEGGGSARERECEEAQKLYPEDFRTVNTTTTNSAGQTLLWPHRYSPNVKAVVVHHTAATYSTDTRSGWEKMRMLYTYHARSKGWGDIGYHYVIDGSGQIYEGKGGGEAVVGGHAYCNNVNTIGIALMGNFNDEQPTVEQTRSLQWLLIDLGRKYNIDYSDQVAYHGNRIDTLIGHEDVVATECPGAALAAALPQIRRNVIAKSYRSAVRYPDVGIAATYSDIPTTPTTFSTGRSAVQVVGSTTYTNRPGASINIQVRVSAWTQPISLRQSVANVSRSDSTIGVWQYYTNGQSVRVRDQILATKNLIAGQSITIPLRVQMPRTAGIYTLTIGSTIITLQVEGRRTPTVTNTRIPANTSATAVSQRGRATVQALPNTTNRPVFYRSADAEVSSSLVGETIRIKLSYDAPTAEIDVGSAGELDGINVRGTVRFSKSNDRCLATAGLVRSSQASPRLTSAEDQLTVRSWDTNLNRFRGTIECQIEAGKIILINELPLEEYMWGLAEQPDTEPYEKQRAIAIAARSYAAHYMQPEYRKFPGKQYDGSDSPAEFQKYGGIAFEENHPRWVEAVKSTAQLVVKKNGEIVKTPYFSSNDGRTRSPEENGWRNFLFAEVFYSKPDPWCQGMTPRGHGVGMSGCGAKGQALEGKTAEQILDYYFPTTTIQRL